jgi:hypothetical protein
MLARNRPIGQAAKVGHTADAVYEVAEEHEKLHERISPNSQPALKAQHAGAAAPLYPHEVSHVGCRKLKDGRTTVGC